MTRLEELKVNREAEMKLIGTSEYSQRYIDDLNETIKTLEFCNSPATFTYVQPFVFIPGR